MLKHIRYAMVTPHGLMVDNSYYSCSVAIKGKWFLVAFYIGNWRMPVIHDPTNKDFIMIIFKNKIVTANKLPFITSYSSDELNKYNEQIEILKSRYRKTGTKSRRRKRSFK